jgi:plasmid stabilization system protein ParE
LIRPLRFVGQTWSQYRAAATWWRNHRDKAPEAFEDDFAVAAHLIRREPGVGVPARFGRYRGVRRVYLERIRYYIYYRESEDAVEILAIRHASRRPPKL